MSATALDRDLQTFAVELFERSGGVADWPVAGGSRFGRGPRPMWQAPRTCRAKSFRWT